MKFVLYRVTMKAFAPKIELFQVWGQSHLKRPRTESNSLSGAKAFIDNRYKIEAWRQPRLIHPDAPWGHTHSKVHRPVCNAAAVRIARSKNCPRTTRFPEKLEQSSVIWSFTRSGGHQTDNRVADAAKRWIHATSPNSGITQPLDLANDIHV